MQKSPITTHHHPLTTMPTDKHQHQQQLQNFTTRHTSHHRPLALVTSGGTAADLEVNAVRFLDNFSTGLRGALSVEQFLKRGYAVVHLMREGSVSPFARVLEDVLAVRGGMTFESLGEVFDCDDASADTGRGELSLNPRLCHSHVLQSTLRTYKQIIDQGLLLTIAFRTVDDYLDKLQLCCEAVNACGALGLVYLAAAVSDFYIPTEKRALHKIQSRDYGLKSQATSSVSATSFGGESNNSEGEKENTAQLGSNNTLTLTLYPVPKVIPKLREEWCPNAFVISFKLETDSTILCQKAVMAMERNKVHLVIGNELATRYEKVFILSHKERDGFVLNKQGENNINSDVPEGYKMTEVTAADGFAMSGMSSNVVSSGTNTNVDALEYATIEYVVRHHFHYISTQMDPTNNNLTSAELASRTTLEATTHHQARLENSYRKLQREKLIVRLKDLAWQAAGSAMGIAISYSVSRMIQQRQHHIG